MENDVQNNLTNHSLALQIIKRAAIFAIIIGSTLTLINQFDALFGSADLQKLPLILVYLTPFLVVGLSQVFGIREARKSLLLNAYIPQDFFTIMLSHNIPLRAVILGLAAGGTNTIIVATTNLSTGLGFDQLPIDLILQALTLPIIFGALSQALSFRRTINQSTSKHNLNILR
jgi:hypothetical protein